MLGITQPFDAAPLLDDVRLAVWPLDIPAMPWWGYVAIAVVVLGAAALVLPRIGGRGR